MISLLNFPYRSFQDLIVNLAALATKKFKLHKESGMWNYKKDSQKGEEKNKEKIVAENNYLKFIYKIALQECI